MYKIKGKYNICEDGRVYSRISHKFLKPCDNNGYKTVTIVLDGKHKRFSLHRLIAETFIYNPEDKPCVNHKDGNKANNSVDNLEWCTHKENSNHAVKTGLITNKHAEFWDKERLNMLRFLKTEYSQREIGHLFDLTQARVSQLLKR